MTEGAGLLICVALHPPVFIQSSKSTGTGVQTNHISVWGWQAMWFNKRVNVDGVGDYHLKVKDIRDWINIAVGEFRAFLDPEHGPPPAAPPSFGTKHGCDI